MKNEEKFRNQEQQEQHLSETQMQSQQPIHEFAMPEDMLRFDAEQTDVPDRVVQRLNRSLKNVPNPARPWWKRLFS